MRESPAIFKRTSDALIIVVTLIVAIFLISPSDAIATGTTHTITIINNCSDNLGVKNNGIYIGLSAKNTSRPVHAHLNKTTDLCTLPNGECPMGWNMKNGDVAVIAVPMSWTSGAIWARTGCDFDGDTCKTTGVNCCDTGGCLADSKNFGVDCIDTPQPPATVAEFTFGTTPTGSDFVDTSTISGTNVSVQVVPGRITKSSSDTGAPYAININNTNAVQILGADATCTDDTDCQNAESFSRCVELPCSTDVDCTNVAGWPTGSTCSNNKCSKGVCVNPYWAGSSGCTDPKGCAAKGLEQSLLPASGWGNITCSSQSDCPDTMDTCVDGSCVNSDKIPYYNYALNNMGVNNSCPRDIQLPVGAMKTLITINTLEYFNRGTDGLNQGTKYVGCISPQEFCTMSCSATNPCPNGLTCENNICGLKRSCKDKPCPSGQTCVDDFCSPRQAVGTPCDMAINDTCTTNDDCISPATCISQKCEGTDPVTGVSIQATTAGDLWGCTGSNSGSCYSKAPNIPQVCTSDIQCADGYPCVQQCTGGDDCNTTPIDTKKTTCTFNSDCNIAGTSQGPLCVGGSCIAQSVCAKSQVCTSDMDCPKPGGGFNQCNTAQNLCTQTETQNCYSNDFCSPSLNKDIGALPLVAVPVPNPNKDKGIECTKEADCDPSTNSAFGTGGELAYQFTPLTCSQLSCQDDTDCASGTCNKISGAPGTYGTCSTSQCVFQEFSCQTNTMLQNFGQCVNPNCCGCPEDPTISHFCTTGNNNAWQEIAQKGIAEVFKTASNTSYSFPFDDISSTFNLSSQVGPIVLGSFSGGCKAEMGGTKLTPDIFCQTITGDSGATCDRGLNVCVASKLTSYTVTFCPAP